ncbi:MAG: hypothetical protein GEU88_15480 [Solirubrobacterales bacterium]|nr:hypothetical protein [Solirubrobacterales bacterium]
MNATPERRSTTTCVGSFDVPLSAARAIELFTAEGERDWVDGWAPRYPASGAETGAVGGVFVTDGPAGDVVWVVSYVGQLERRYARFDHLGTVGTVEVRCRPAGRSTSVEVTYRLTAVNAAAEPELARFEREYADLMRTWRAAIAAAIERGSISPDPA